MKYEVKPAEKSTVKLTITFSPEEWAEANNKAYVQNRSRYAVNGFRKGKVPKHVLELYYGRGLFYEDALNLLFGEHYEKILESEKENFTAVGDPSVSLGEDFSEEHIVLVADIPVKPDVTIGAYKGIKIPEYEYTVTDADVEQEIETARRRVAEKAEVTDRPAEEGDVVTIDFAGTMDGVTFDGGTAEGHALELGSHSFIPGFEEGVEGMSLGEVKDIPVTFPEDYQSDALKGKPAVFKVTLHKIEKKILPPLDEAFAKKMGSESVEAYTKKVRDRLEASAKQRSLEETEHSILTSIAKGASAEIPQAMVDRQREIAVQRVEYGLMYQGVKLDDYLAYMGTSREEYMKRFDGEARSAVLNQLILEKLIKIENITASEEEIEKKIAEQAESVGKEPEEYKKTMDPRQIEYIEKDIKVTKMFEFLKANNEMVKTEAKINE